MTSTLPRRVNLQSAFPHFNNASIGIADLLADFDHLFNTNNNSSFPPYNIEKVGEHNYVLSLAVAGFSKEEISITHQKMEGKLLISGTKEKDETEEKKVYSHRGIANRNFTQSFVVADDVIVNNAELVNGMLTVELERIIPEEKQPQVITIK